MTALAWLLLGLPIVGGIAGRVIAAWHNENCSADAAYVLQTCTRLKPVHTTLIGFLAGLGIAGVLWIALKGMWFFRDAFRTRDPRKPE